MSNIFITSDYHFMHQKSFIYEARGFSSVEEMNEALIENHNKLIHTNDIVYILGDCIMGNSKESIQYLKRLNGIKYLAFGNHDTDARLALYKQENIFEDIQMGYRFSRNKKTFILTHYPTLVNNNDSKPYIFNIHGHTHSKEKYEFPLAYNAALDANDNTPVRLEEITFE